VTGTLGQRARGRDNNFNLVRLLAAGCVLVSHSWPLSGTPGEPFERFAGFSLGHFGVDIFFVVSGFLVTGSLFARRTLGAFVRARALRIFPALTVNAFGTALVIGPLVTALPLAAYFTSPLTWAYAVLNSTTWPWGVVWSLPGVFRGLPAGDAVNGALWSLPWELTMYAMLVVLGALALRTRPWLGARGVKVVVLGIALLATLGHGLNEGADLSRAFRVVQGLRLVALFFTGASLQLLRDRVPLSGVAAAVARRGAGRGAPLAGLRAGRLSPAPQLRGAVGGHRAGRRPARVQPARGLLVRLLPLAVPDPAVGRAHAPGHRAADAAAWRRCRRPWRSRSRRGTWWSARRWR
jgi:peptidoglycan/LPS O-acetylase OafA/YrhL